MAVETVISQQAPQLWMASKNRAEKSLALVPWRPFATILKNGNTTMSQ
jgi:hypothetical protein